MKEIIGNDEKQVEETSSWDSLTENSEDNWQQMQAERSVIEQEKRGGRLHALGKKIMDVLRKLIPHKEKTSTESEPISESEQNDTQDTITERDKVIGDSDWDISPTQDHAYLELGRKENAVRQEYIERSLNESFMTMDELEAVFSEGAENASKRTVEYGGKTITIYNTGNVPFRFLEHSIQYSGATGTPLVENPSLWDRSEGDASQELGDKFSNMLSMQYRDSIMRRVQAPNDGICYGMLRVPPASLATMNTGGQVLNKTRDDIALYNWQEKYSPSELQDKIAGSGFLEVQSFRYDEQGNPAFRPDFIEAPADGINEATLKQAAYFDVPIFEIPRSKVKTEMEVVDRKIEEYILRKVADYEQDSSPEEVATYEERLRRLINTPTAEWGRWGRIAQKELFALVKQKEELNSQSQE